MIQHIYWDVVSPRNPARSKLVYSIWPSPIDSDHCFQSAGFAEFADSNDEWDSAWQSFVGNALDNLASIGAPSIRSRIEVSAQRTLLNRVMRSDERRNAERPSLTEQVVTTTMNNGFPDAVIDFGDERLVTLIAGNGHPILWLFFAESYQFSIKEFVGTISSGVGTTQKTLDWAAFDVPKMSG